MSTSTPAAGAASRCKMRRERVDAEVRRLAELGASVVRVMEHEGLDHDAVAMIDPEGIEFDAN